MSQGNKVRVYSKDQCMQCKMVKRWLTEHDVEFEELNVDHMDEQNRGQTIEFIKSELGFSSLPVIVTADGATFKGFNVNELRKLA